MNFDMNTLSTLMQLMSAQKPQAPQNSSVNNSNDNSYNGYNSANYDTAKTRGNTTQSVFAMQNGLGERVDFEEKKQTQNTSSATQNPMSSLFEMMSGKSAGGGDMMSNLMPMLLNMMNGKNSVKTANNTNNADAQKSKTTNSDGNMQNSSNTAPKTNADCKNTSDNLKRDNLSDADLRNRKTQSVSRDKYSPIAFAGYALISALNKLYISKTFRIN